MKLFLLLFALEIANGQFLRNRCVLEHDGSRGVCRRSDQCQQVFDLMKCNGVRPTICGFEGLSPIVCCPLKNVRPRGCRPNPVTTEPPISERISVKKCKEYKKCGLSIRPVIIGGIDANPGEFPHMAAMGWTLADGSGFAWNCGGSLISENFVLTAAHCSDAGRDPSLSSSQPTTVRLGVNNLKEINSESLQDIPILSIIKHPEYKPPLKYNDIALLKLAFPARLNENVKPICLWQSPHFPSENSIATGWGKLGYINSVTSDTLQKVDLKLIGAESCPSYYKSPNRKLPNGIVESQLCAGELQGGKDTCQGDSGGPLQIVDPDLSCAHHLVGLTSFGIGCGSPNSPAVYTRVSSYIDWIESVVWP